MSAIDWTKEQVRKTATQMRTDNPVLEAGQLGFESDTLKGKVGPGSYNSLEYKSDIDIAKANDAWENDQRDGGAESSGGGAWGEITGTLSDQTDLQNILETQANAIGAVGDEVDALEATVAALSTVAVDRDGSAVAFDVYAIYNTADSPTSGTVTVDYTGAVAGTQVLCFFNHGTQPGWPSGWTVVGTWDDAALNAVVLTYHGGTNVSGFIISNASGGQSNPGRVYRLSTDFAVTSATPLTMDGFTNVPVPAGQMFMVFMQLRGTCSGTSGGYIGFYADTGTDHIVRMAGRSDNVADAAVYAAPGANGGYNSPATSYPWFVSTLANNFGMITGTIMGGAADALFEVKARSVNAAQTFTVYKDGSYLMLMPM